MLDEFYIEELARKKFSFKSSSFLNGIGDDSAICRINSDKIVVSCDSQVEDVHFSLKYFTPQEIGFRALSVALSDICAMGAEPKFFLNSLFLPNKTSKKFVDKLFQGFNKASKFYNVELVGGNVCKSKSLIVDITVIGETIKNKYIEREGSNSGDFVYVSGKLGDASLGLSILKKKSIFNYREKLLISKYKSPKAKVSLGKFLGQSSFVTSMIDITDGLTLDLARLLGKNSSNKGACLVWEDIPKSDNVSRTSTMSSFMKSVFSGGDDYELLFTIKRKKAYEFDLLCKKNNFKVFKIGAVDSSGSLTLKKGGKISNLQADGFVHKF